MFHSLYEYPCAGKAFPEFFGRSPFSFFEDPVEIGNVVEAAGIGNFCDAVGSLYQQPRGVTDAYFVEGVDKCLACFTLEKTTKAYFCHAGDPGCFGQTNLFAEIAMQVLEHFFDPAAAIRYVSATESIARKNGDIPGCGKIVQDGEQFQHGVEPCFINQ